MQSQKWQLTLQTLSLVVGFMCWVIISSLMAKIKLDIPLTANQVALVTAIPVILGSILRIFLGYWTNRFGARSLFFISFLILIFPVFYLSMADSFFDLIIGGLVLGMGGAVFSIGVTSLPKYYPKERHGFVNGIYGAGNIGTAITSFSAPVLANALGWQNTIRLFLVPIILFAILNFLFGDRKEQRVHKPLTGQIKSVYKNEKLWFLSLFYFITFGSFVAFTVYLPNFLVTNFKLTTVDAGLRTAGFITLATILRPIGGWLGDKYNPFEILFIVFAGLTVSGVLLSFSPTITLYTIGCLAVAVCAGIGNGTIFKLVPYYFSEQAGIANGIVSAIGGLGGFFPPLVLSMVFGITGQYAIGFMSLAMFSLASFVIVVWMYYLEKLNMETKILENVGQSMMVTNTNGVIEKVNHAFTRVTGYQTEEAVGKNPSLLQSGKHDQNFYQKMWGSIHNQGYWQGEIWNKRKNGEIYLEWLTISEVKNDAGEVKYYIGLFSDISEKKS
ncbi:nitrate/nitrite transporter [Bacillus sp. AFS076308]|uniref:nitrate/nitrite transporter n=1 Tax=unclassified Bacillus (in: firmicutes) TaxID=185979 RepID=UPI000BF94C78|nr:MULTISPECIES: nitrate/nitrite transporter [unclassified Bacillus (in: firmicutes)]PFO08376.1 nitrate/nitrite transporter [Bacillus sp. AFS076308]PGV50615.1 nitrate/nitrite transporter [Bacillus sp. AFS037270]